MPTRTDKVPNTSATAASCGTDLNGAAVKNACDTLARAAAPVRRRNAERKKRRERRRPNKIVFADNMVFDADDPRRGFPFAEVLQRAYFARTSLSATGFYRTPEIHYDRDAGRGKPFHYFAVGAAVTEVEVDGFTGMMHIRRVDILHDVGDAINRGVARGQIEGGFVQGAGWLTTEELVWDSKGRLLTHSPDTYKIPAIGDTPGRFQRRVSVRTRRSRTSSTAAKPSANRRSCWRSPCAKQFATRWRRLVHSGGEIALASPATCEAIFQRHR